MPSFFTPRRDADGLLKVTLSYIYKVNDEEFDSSESFAFTIGEDAERFESRCRERRLQVHYQQGKHEICVLLEDEMHWRNVATTLALPRTAFLPVSGLLYPDHDRAAPPSTSDPSSMSARKGPSHGS
jgi:hypothetical protein